MTRRCPVTGGAGCIGSHLVDHLVAEDWAVTVLDDFSTGTRANLGEAQSRGDVRIVQGSILDPGAVGASDGGKRCNLPSGRAVRPPLAGGALAQSRGSTPPEP
jgi:nucleoside-diphosphate-sugar epimerase